MKTWFKQSKSLLANQRGNALLMALGAAAIIGVSSMFVLKNLDEGNKANREVIKQIRGKVEGQKVIAMAGFLVSSNFIACRQGGWNDAGDDESIQYCKWIGDRADAAGLLDLAETEGEADAAQQAAEYTPEKFGLYNESINEDGNLVYDIIVSRDGESNQNSFGKTVILKDEGARSSADGEFDFSEEGDVDSSLSMNGFMELNGTLTFEFVNLEEDEQFAKMVGMDNRDDLPENSMILKTDRDDWVIHAKVELKIKVTPEKTMPLVLGAAYRRPMAKTKLRVVQSVCQAKCQAPLSENDFAVCRGPQTSDNDTTVDIELTLENEGPGFVYDVSYLRAMYYDAVQDDDGNVAGGLMTQSDDTANTNEAIKFDLKSGYMPFGSLTQYTDKVECQAFVSRTQETITTQGNWQTGGTTSTATATSATSDVGTDADPSQHQMRGGQVNYLLSANAEGSNLEPFRIMADVGAGDVAATHKNVHTTVYIYVAPSH